MEVTNTNNCDNILKSNGSSDMETNYDPNFILDIDESTAFVESNYVEICLLLHECMAEHARIQHLMLAMVNDNNDINCHDNIQLETIDNNDS